MGKKYSNAGKINIKFRVLQVIEIYGKDRME